MWKRLETAPENVREQRVVFYETLESLMDTAFYAVKTGDDQQEAAMLVRKYDLISLPVTDESGRLVGAIGVNNIVDVIEEEDTEDFERMAALVPNEDDYAASSVWTLALHRLPWLLILMASSVLCAWLIQSYEALLLASAMGGVMMSNRGYGLAWSTMTK